MLNDDYTDKVVTVKLTSGEEFIARLERETLEGSYVFRTPCVFQVMGESNGRFMPWMATINTKEIEILSQHVLCMAETITPLADGYLEAIGESVIAKPPEKKIIV